jgi:hypothetical protein
VTVWLDEVVRFDQQSSTTDNSGGEPARTGALPERIGDEWLSGARERILTWSNWKSFAHCIQPMLGLVVRRTGAPESTSFT